MYNLGSCVVILSPRLRLGLSVGKFSSGTNIVTYVPAHEGTRYVDVRAAWLSGHWFGLKWVFKRVERFPAELHS